MALCSRTRTERQNSILLVRDDVKYVAGKDYVYFLKRVDSATVHDQWTCKYSYATLRRVRAGVIPDVGTTLEAIRDFVSKK